MLVEEKLTFGRRLLNQLAREGLEVTVAFWARTVYDEKWRLYIASPGVNADRTYTAFGFLRRALAHCPDVEIADGEVRQIDASESFAQEALSYQPERGSYKPYRYKDRRLGDTSIDGCYIYPPVPIRLTPEEAALRMVNLLQRPDTARPSRITLRDGSTFEAFPSGLEITQLSQTTLSFVDTASNQPRTLQAHEVVGID